MRFIKMNYKQEGMAENMKRGNNKIIKKAIAYLLVFALCIPLLGVAAQKKMAEAYVSSDGQWYYDVNADGTVTITGVKGSASNIVIPATVDGLPVTSIGSDAFYGCTSLSEVTIPNSVTSIGSYAFFECTSLSEVTIPNSVTSIGSYAFWGCTSLSKVTIPNSVTSIGSSAFFYCTSLSEVTIPNSVTSIGDFAFGYCTSLSEVTIPNSVISIGSYAFFECSASLVIYALPGSVAETYANNYGITVKTDTAINPVVTPTPIPTPSPTPAMGVTFAPIVTEQSPTPTPTVTPTPTPELGISANQTELSADAQGVFASNKVEMAVTSSYSCTVSSSDSWLKVCKKMHRHQQTVLSGYTETRVNGREAFMYLQMKIFL